jgi:glutamate/aspartate transport system substrate-binding protein
VTGRRTSLRRAIGAIALAAASMGSAEGLAQAIPGDALTGVLKRVHDAGAVRIGFRPDAVPFSMQGADGAPYGYSIDLCAEIAADLGEAVGGMRLRIDPKRVTPEDRIERVAAGDIDLECGATTNDAARRARVAFSPVIFVTGTRLAVKRGGPVRGLRDLGPAQTLAVARGTTNEAVVRRMLAARKSGTAVTATVDLAEAFQLLVTGRAQAVASDDILLQGYIAQKRLADLGVVGELLSYEAYGIVYARHDPALDAVVRGTFTRLAESGELRQIYNRWFLRTLPNGVRLGVPMSVQLTRAFQVLGLASE